MPTIPRYLNYCLSRTSDAEVQFRTAVRTGLFMNWTDGPVQRSAFLERIECVRTRSNVFER